MQTDSHQVQQQREQPVNQPDTGWHTGNQSGDLHAEINKLQYKPQSNGTFASLLSFAQMYYDPGYSEHSDEKLVSSFVELLRQGFGICDLSKCMSCFLGNLLFDCLKIWLQAC